MCIQRSKGEARIYFIIYFMKLRIFATIKPRLFDSMCQKNDGLPSAFRNVQPGHFLDQGGSLNTEQPGGFRNIAIGIS